MARVLLRIAAQPAFAFSLWDRRIEKSKAFELFGAELVAGRKDSVGLARSGAARQNAHGGDRKMVELHLWVRKPGLIFGDDDIAGAGRVDAAAKGLALHNGQGYRGSAHARSVPADAFHRDARIFRERGAVAAGQAVKVKVEIAAKREHSAPAAEGEEADRRGIVFLA